MSLLNNIALWQLNSKPARQSNRRFMNWSEVKSLLLLADQEQLGDAKAFLKQAVSEGKQAVTVFVYKGKPGQEPAFEYEHIVVGKKQLTVFGLPQPEVLSTLNSKKADLLINLGSSENATLLGLSKWTDVPVKIASFEHPVFDLSIAVSNRAEFLKQVLVYLEMIKTK